MPKSKNLRYLRKEKGLTQKAFADAFGVTRETVCVWETKKNAIPAPTAKRIAAFFGIDYADFCDVDLERRDIETAPPTKQEMDNLIKFRALPDVVKNAMRVAVDNAYKETVTEKPQQKGKRGKTK